MFHLYLYFVAYFNWPMPAEDRTRRIEEEDDEAAAAAADDEAGGIAVGDEAWAW